jgi:hypothetical protein
MTHKKFYLVSNSKCPICNIPFIKARTGGDWSCILCNQPMEA